MAAVLVVVTAGVVLIARPGHALRISVLDVGQGDAILLEADSGARMLIDGGPDPDLLVRRLDERIPVWDRRIDIVLLTHPHEDHAAGLAGLVPRYRIGAVAETGMATDGASVRELRAVAARNSIRRVRLASGDTLAFGQARIEVVWPPRDTLPAIVPTTGRAINDTSLVLDVSMGRQRALLTGDIEDDKDDLLLDRLRRDGRRWDLLKVAHHGSATASSQPLLEALRPRLSIISSGVDNRYGHPAPATLERLRDVGSSIWRTDVRGTFSVAFDGRPRTTAALLAGTTHRTPCPGRIAGEPAREADDGRACYPRLDGGSHSNRSSRTARLDVTVSQVDATRHGRRRGGLDARLSGFPGRRAGGPAAGRHGRAPPRRRQVLAAGPSPA